MKTKKLLDEAKTLAAPFCFAAEPTRSDAEKDAILKAMLTELDRNRDQLQLKDFAKPFFIQYRLEDIEDYQTQSSFGASVGEAMRHQRLVGRFVVESVAPEALVQPAHRQSSCGYRAVPAHYGRGDTQLQWRRDAC